MFSVSINYGGQQYVTNIDKNRHSRIDVSSNGNTIKIKAIEKDGSESYVATIPCFNGNFSIIMEQSE